MYYAAPFEGELYRARIDSVERIQDNQSGRWIDVVEVRFINLMWSSVL